MSGSVGRTAGVPRNGLNQIAAPIVISKAAQSVSSFRLLETLSFRRKPSYSPKHAEQHVMCSRILSPSAASHCFRTTERRVVCDGHPARSEFGKAFRNTLEAAARSSFSCCRGSFPASESRESGSLGFTDFPVPCCRHLGPTCGFWPS